MKTILILLMSVAAFVVYADAVPQTDVNAKGGVVNECADARKQYLLGKNYLEGNGVDKDPVKAFTAFKRSADLGCSEAKVEVARCYLKGIGVAKDVVEAAMLIEPVAESGNVEAQRVMGYLYQEGLGYDKDIKTAAVWYEKAAVKGDVPAMYYYAIALQSMNGDTEEVESWLKKSAEENYAPSFYALGKYHERKKDYGAALKWLEKSAREGHEKAIRTLFKVYYMRLSQWGVGDKEYADKKLYYLYLKISTLKDVDTSLRSLAEAGLNRAERTVQGRKLLQQARELFAEECGVDPMDDGYQEKQKDLAKERLNVLLAKAKNAAQGSIVIKGFYLGMPIADAKELTSCYLPESVVEIEADNSSKGGQCIKLDASKGLPTMYLCQADDKGLVYRLSLPQKLLKKMFTYKMYKNVSDAYGKWMRDFAAEYKLTFSAGKVSEEWEVNDFMQKMIQEVYEYVDEKNEFKMAYFGASKEWTNLSAEQVLKIKTPTESGYILGYISTRMKYWLDEKGANDGTLRIERLQE